MKMKFPYGYIRGTDGADGEQIDCYIGPDESAKDVYIVHQNNPDTHEYDEDKCFLNFSSLDEARKAYLSHHSRGLAALGNISIMSVEEFKGALKRAKSVKLEPRLHLKPGKMLLSDSALEDKPGLIAEGTVSDLNNWLTTRIRGSHIDNYKKGLRGETLESAMIRDLQEVSDGPLDRIAIEGSRSAVAGGRYMAFEELDGEIDHYVRSEAMDQNTCGPCEDGDGTEWDSLDEVDWSPGDDCEGDDACRGQLMPVFSDENTTELE